MEMRASLVGKGLNPAVLTHKVNNIPAFMCFSVFVFVC